MAEQRIIILHTNDIHGRVEGLARVATLVARIRDDNPGVPVIYLDAGDSEETSRRLSNLTKGAAMHRLLCVAGCAASTVGNGSLLRYGPDALAAQEATGGYPLLLANLRLPDDNPLPGTQPTAILEVGPVRLGLVGVTAEFPDYVEFFGLHALPVLPLIRECVAALRQDGADAVVLLSHLGIHADRAAAGELQEEVIAVVGAHSHTLLPEGEWVGAVLVAQAGQYAEHLGRLDLLWDGDTLRVAGAQVMPVDEDLPPHPAMQAEVAAIEAEVEQFLDHVIGELAGPLDLAADRECAAGDWLADVLRAYMQAEVGVISVGQAITQPLAAGPLRRLTLWDACDSSANPGVATMTGAQLLALVRKGLDPEFASSTARALRGRPRGLLHLSGARVADGQLWVGDAPVDPARSYQVAGTDWELQPYGSYVPEEWHLPCRYDISVILREAAERYLAGNSPVAVETGRIVGALV